MPIIEVNRVAKEYLLVQFTNIKQSALSGFNRPAGRPAGIKLVTDATAHIVLASKGIVMPFGQVCLDLAWMFGVPLWIYLAMDSHS